MPNETPQPEALARELERAHLLISDGNYRFAAKQILAALRPCANPEESAPGVCLDCGHVSADSLRPAAVSNEQVEQVARAIYEAEPVPAGMERFCSFEHQKELNGPSWIVFDRARAAIAAMSLTPAQKEKPDGVAGLCEDCPPPNYPTDKTRCTPCPRRAATPFQASPGKEVEDLIGRLRESAAYRGKMNNTSEVAFIEWEAADMLERMAGGWRPDQTRREALRAAGGCYCSTTCGAPIIMGRQTACLRNPPLRPGELIPAEPSSEGEG